MVGTAVALNHEHVSLFSYLNIRAETVIVPFDTGRGRNGTQDLMSFGHVVVMRIVICIPRVADSSAGDIRNSCIRKIRRTLVVVDKDLWEYSKGSILDIRHDLGLGSCQVEDDVVLSRLRVTGECG